MGRNNMSESEEMYLITLTTLEETGCEPPIPLSQLAQELSVRPVSANQMVRKLKDAGLVVYAPYKGVSLTTEGRQRALRILRRRRLWEVFFVEKLNLPWSSAAELACQVEHLAPDEAVERLAAFLDEPQVSPQGRPIPKPDSTYPPAGEVPLSQLEIDAPARVSALQADDATLVFLHSQGIRPGAKITLLGAGGDGALLADVEERRIFLTPTLAEAIRVQPGVAARTPGAAKAAP